MRRRALSNHSRRGACASVNATMAQVAYPASSKAENRAARRVAGHRSARSSGATASCSTFSVWRDIKVRYKQTVLGVALGAHPAGRDDDPVHDLLRTARRAVAASRRAVPVVRVRGLSLWTFFANAVSLAANSLVGSSHLISKVYFPRLLVPLAAIVSGFVDFAIAFAFLLVLHRLLRHRAVVADRDAAAVSDRHGRCRRQASGILLAALIVTYRDFRYVIMFLIQLWLFATPVLYPLDIIPANSGDCCTRSTRWPAWSAARARRSSANRSRST